MKQPSHHPTLLALAALATLLGYSGITFAAPVLVAGSSATANSLPATPLSSSSLGYESSSSDISNAIGEGSGYSFASQYGAYAVSSRATGIATGAANASFLTTVFNNSATAQSYSLSFHIYGGYLETMLESGATLTGAESLVASYVASVKVNGNPVFSSSATLTHDLLNGITLNQTGTVLSGANLSGGGYYSWGNDYYTVDLGSVAAGSSIDVLAEVSDAAFADVGTYSFDGGGGYGDCGYGGYPTATGGGITTQVVVVEPLCFKGAARAWYGDPLAINGLPDDPPTSGPGFSITQLQIPEPASLALAMLALGAAGVASRRQKASG